MITNGNGHIGIISQVSGNSFKYINGNTSASTPEYKVVYETQNWYTIDSSHISSILHVDYESVEPSKYPADAFEDNNSFGTAKSFTTIMADGAGTSLGIPMIGVSRKMSIHKSDDVDYFYFELFQRWTSQNKIDMPAVFDMDMYLYDSSYNLVRSSSNSGHTR